MQYFYIFSFVFTNSTILSTSSPVSVKACEKLKNVGIRASLINSRFINPFDKEFLDGMTGKKLFFFEEYVEQNSLYSKTLSYFNEKQIKADVYGVNIPNKTYSVASRKELLRETGLDLDSIVEFVKTKLNI